MTISTMEQYNREIRRRWRRRQMRSLACEMAGGALLLAAAAMLGYLFLIIAPSDTVDEGATGYEISEEEQANRESGEGQYKWTQE